MSNAGIMMLACFGLAFVSSYIQGVIGFGLGMIFVAGLAVGSDLSPMTAAVVANVLILVQGAFHAGHDRGLLAWRPIGWTALGLLPGTLVGFVLLSSLSGEPLRCLWHLLGLFILASSLWTLFGRSAIHIGTPRQACLGWGAAAGLCGGLFGVPGPPIVVLFYGLSLSQASRRTSMLALFMLLAGLRSLLAWSNGSLDRMAWLLILAALPAVLLGGWLALVAPLPIAPRTLRRLILGLLLALGLKLVFLG